MHYNTSSISPSTSSISPACEHSLGHDYHVPHTSEQCTILLPPSLLPVNVHTDMITNTIYLIQINNVQYTSSLFPVNVHTDMITNSKYHVPHTKEQCKKIYFWTSLFILQTFTLTLSSCHMPHTSKYCNIYTQHPIKHKFCLFHCLTSS